MIHRLIISTNYCKMKEYWARSVAVNALPCQGRDRRFESGRARNIAKLVEEMYIQPKDLPGMEVLNTFENQRKDF